MMAQWPFFTLIFFACHVVAMSSTIYNPFLYAWMNDNFKKEFRTVIPCLFWSRNGASSSTSYTQYTNVGTDPQSGVAPRSPIQNGGGDATALMKDTKAYYDADASNVHLTVLAANTNNCSSSNSAIVNNVNNTITSHSTTGEVEGGVENHEMQPLNPEKGLEKGEENGAEDRDVRGEDAETLEKLIGETTT